jgi:hypothetical protein
MFAPVLGPPLGPLAAPLHGPVGLGRALRFSYQPSLLCGVRAAPLGPPARRNLRLGTGGGRVQHSRGFDMRARRHGERRGGVSSSLAHPLGDPIDPPRARCAAAGFLRPGARAAPRRSAVGPVGPGRVLRFSFSPSPLCGARVVPMGPPRRLAATLAGGTGGGRVLPSRGCVRPASRLGGRRGTCPSLSPSSCAMVVQFSKPIVTIPAGINRSRRMKPFFAASLTVFQRNVTHCVPAYR